MESPKQDRPARPAGLSRFAFSEDGFVLGEGFRALGHAFIGQSEFEHFLASGVADHHFGDGARFLCAIAPMCCIEGLVRVSDHRSARSISCPKPQNTEK